MSEDAVMLLSEGKDLIGQSVYSTYDSTEIRVAGIMKPIKMRNSMQPYLVRLVSYGNEEQMPSWAFDSGLRIFSGQRRMFRRAFYRRIHVVGG